MTALITLLILPFSFWGLGYLPLKIMDRKPWGHFSVPFVHLIAFALGIILFSYYWFVVGLMGMIGKTSLYVYWGLSLLAIFLAKNEFVNLGMGLKRLVGLLFRSSWAIRLLSLQLLIIVAVTFVRCWASYIEGDSLVYHLSLPKQYVLKGTIWKVPFSEHAFWPLFTEMCFIPGEIVRSLTVSKFVSFLIYGAASFLPGLFVYEKTRNLLAAVVSYAIVASAPIFFFHAPSTYNDISFAFFLAASLLILEGRDPTRQPEARLLFLSGLLCGAAMACKYLGIYGLLALALLFVVQSFGKKDEVLKLRHLIPFSVGLLITGSPFYVRAFLEYGNPVFPFAQKVFGTSFGYGMERVGIVGSNLSDFAAGAGRGVIDFFLLPVRITLKPVLFGGDKIGFLFLGLGGLIFLAIRRNVRLLIFCLAYTLIWFSLSQYSRYLTPIYILVAAMIGLGYAKFREFSRKWNRAVMIFILLVLGFQTTWAGFHAYKDFVLREDEPIEEIAHWLNQEIADHHEKVLVLGDERIYYYDFAAFREKTFRNFTQYPDHENPVETVQLLDNLGVRFWINAELKSQTGDENSRNREVFRNYFLSLAGQGFYTLKGTKISREGIQYSLYRRVLGESVGAIIDNNNV